MPAFVEKYNAAQRAAMAEAILDRRMKARTVVELAQAGQLEHNGVALPGFATVVGTVRNEASKERRRRSGHVAKELASTAPRDLVEALARELLGEAVKMTAEWKRTPIKTRDAERGRQIARLVREAAAIPAATEPRPPKPGAKRDGQRNDGATTGGLAGAILKDHARTTAGSPNTATRTQTPSPPTTQTHDAQRTATDETTQRPNDETNNAPGSHLSGLASM